MPNSQTSDLVLAIVAISILILLLLSFIISFLFIYKERKKQHIFEKTQLQSQFSQTLLQSQLEIQEQTLKTISQEIHDNVGQVLTLAKLNLATSTSLTGEEAEKINTSKQLIGKAIQDLRDLSRSLNTDYVEEMGFIRSIEYELELLQKTGTVIPAFSINGKPVKLEKQTELILFRMVQEAIHNIMKHAEAKQINCSIVFTAEELSIRIEDDGKGFDPSPLHDEQYKGFGLGLRTMSNRATLIGARFVVESSPGNGTAVSFYIPVNNNSI
jgi:two-component system, NarL family, sensor kinase